MKKVLLDSDVVLDVLLERQPHFRSSAAVWIALEKGDAVPAIAAHAVTTIYYLYRKQSGAAAARKTVSSLLRAFRVAPVDGSVLEDALSLPSSHFEDAVTASAARLAGCEIIVTRDMKGFVGSPVRAFSPEAALPLLSSD